MLVDLSKTVVREGIKAASPLIGTFATEVAATLAGSFIDARTRETSDALFKRLVGKVREELASFHPGEIDPECRGPVSETLEALLSDADVEIETWAAADFDPERAARAVLENGADRLVGLSPDERELCARLIAALFRALGSEQSVVRRTETRFRQMILQKLEELPAAIANGAVSSRAQAERLLASAAVRVPVQTWSPDLSPPGALLRADIDTPVPFHGRADEMAAFMDRGRKSRIAIDVLTGPGGVGKTRFLIEACRRLRKEGWIAGFLDGRLQPDLEWCWRALFETARPIMIVFDYAELRRDQLAAAALKLLETRRGQPTRLVLLARAADDWWDELRGQPDGVGDLYAGPASERRRLAPLTMSTQERAASFEIAASHFAERLGRSVDARPAGDLDAAHFESTLILHMAALAAVEGVELRGDQGILDHILRRERRFWSDHAAERDLPKPLHDAIGQFMSVITLRGGASTLTDAMSIARRMPLLDGQPVATLRAVCELLHDIYPGDRWIEPVLPDLLGEHLVQTELGDATDALLEVAFDGACPE